LFSDCRIDYVCADQQIAFRNNFLTRKPVDECCADAGVVLIKRI
jgi:hypothetical protein